MGLIYLTSEDYLNPKLSSLVCWNRINGIADFGKMRLSPILRTRHLSCGGGPVTALVGHHDHQTSRHLISLCEGLLKKESTAITQDAWTTFNITMNRFMPARINKFFENLHDTMNACFQEGEGPYSVCFNETLFITYLVSLKNENKGKWLNKVRPT